MTDSPDPIDPTYGYDLRGLCEVGAPLQPQDFAEFWRETYRQARRIDLRLSRREIECPDPRYTLEEVEYDSWEGVRIGGWLAQPKQVPPSASVVVGHGYGGRSGPDYTLPFDQAVLIFPCARGFHRSAAPELPSVAGEHVLHGIESRESYIHRGCVVDFWLAASVLQKCLPVELPLFYHGGSFGGGIGALALPWDSRFQAAFLDVPSFGNHPLRVTLPCYGSGGPVKALFEQGHPEILQVLQYFDAASAAQHIQIPTFVAAALRDPAVPPPGQFAVYNALRCSKELYVRQVAHSEEETMQIDTRKLKQQLRTWFEGHIRKGIHLTG